MERTVTEQDFSIVRGGLLERFLALIRLEGPSRRPVSYKIMFFILITWAPIAILTALEGTFWGNKVEVTFLEEFATHVRFLIAIPLMIIAEKIVDNRTKIVIRQFDRAGLVPAEARQAFETAKYNADRMCESVWPEAVILLLIVASIVFRLVFNTYPVTTWAFPFSDAQHDLSIAGYWAGFFSLPVFQFFMARWIWRWIIWFRLLWLISRAGLRLYPAHPDRSGGLGFLGEPPIAFAVIIFMLGIVLASILAERMLYLDAQLNEYYGVIALFVVLCILLNVAPLLVFALPISLARRKGIHDYNALVITLHRAFDNRWIGDVSHQPDLLGNPDPSSAADLNAMYEAVSKMSPLPFNLKIMLASVLVSLLPLLPVIALQIPLTEMFKTLMSILF